MNDASLSGGIWDRILALGVFLAAIGVYTVTLTPTVPFWDGGEYIAASYILGVPHAPGTPLYVLVGRVFSMIPVATVAQRVNWLSAVSSALAVLFLYLSAVKLARGTFPVSRNRDNAWLARLAGVTAALLAAFATTFWTNAIEAEVYAGSCALMAFALWLLLRWDENLGRGNEDALLLLITYVVALGVGIHLAVAVIAWPAVIFVFLRRPGYLKRWDYLGWGAVTLLTLGFGIQKPLLLIPVAVLALSLLLGLVRGRMPRLALGASLVFLLGISVHLFLLIRAGQDPIINEASPKDLHSLWLMLIRDQFKPGSPLDRRADLGYQFGHMYLRYLEWNFTLFLWKGREFFQLPLLLTLAGGLVHLWRDRRRGIAMWILFGFLGPAMVVYLNFRVGEVRERDYFFVQNFMFLTVWTGIGAAWFVETLRGLFRSRAAGRAAALVASLVILAGAAAPVVHNWESHDRRGFQVARNYAHNMLVGLEPDAVLFTNGDNDTFPLWYLQEVEGFRKDVRVVNLSLLNTRWYIRQIRDLEPRVPVRFTDKQVDDLRHLRTRTGEVLRIKDQAVRHILAVNRGERPVYMAVSVPDRVGLDDRLSMEGLVFRVREAGEGITVDVEATHANLHEKYIYTGTRLEDPTRYATEAGMVDGRVFEDKNELNLLQNYAAAHVQLALALTDRGRTEEALAEIEHAEMISPRYPSLGTAKGYILEREKRWDEALAHYQTASRQYPGEWDLVERAGAVLVRMERYEESIPYFERAMEMAPDSFEPYRGLLSAHYNLGDYASALRVMRFWGLRHPEDEQVRRLIRALEGSLETGEDPFGSDTASTPGSGEDGS